MRNAIVLAAGKGTRMKSQLSKVMHPIIDRPMLGYIIDALRAVHTERIVIVVGYQAQSIMDAYPDCEFAMQMPQLGTGHAVMQCTQLKEEKGQTLVINGDGPCITPETLEKLFQANERASCTLLTSVLEDGAHYGRIVRDSQNNVVSIVEAKDCTPEQKKIREINAGMYCFNNQDLFSNIHQLETNNAQHEYYLTDMVKILSSQGKIVKGMVIEDRDEVMGINDCIELNKAYELMKHRINTKWMKEGIQIVDPNRTVIGKDVQIGHDVIIHPNVEITGKTVIGDFVEILPNSMIQNAIIENNVCIDNSKVENCLIKEGRRIGPFSYEKGNKNGLNIQNV
ncbi:MAG: bifunctional N-acetylglucosamine-1-phosphate uridyltransferase/glucosamine-1-phosphate acetyltransferase [Floccifex sp.]